MDRVSDNRERLLYFTNLGTLKMVKILRKPYPIQVNMIYDRMVRLTPTFTLLVNFSFDLNYCIYGPLEN